MDAQEKAKELMAKFGDKDLAIICVNELLENMPFADIKSHDHRIYLNQVKEHLCTL